MQSNIWTGTLKANGTVLSDLRRLTDVESLDWPMTWTRDSRAVVFASERSGAFQVYKQDFEKGAAEAITSGPETGVEVRLSPDGQWLLYTIPEANTNKERVMRVPVGGGEPEQVLVADHLIDMQCSQVPGGLCDLEEAEGPAGTVSLFDPVKGRGPTVLRNSHHPAISPDGKQIAYLVPENRERRIRIADLHGVTESEVTAAVAGGLQNLDWATDGSGFFATEQLGTTETRLLHIDRSGASQVLRSEPGLTDLWGIPSPNGRYLAMPRKSVAGNVWMIENP